MNPWTQLERLESWYEALTSGDYKQARKQYIENSHTIHLYPPKPTKKEERFCCLAVAGDIRGSHAGSEVGACEWVGVEDDGGHGFTTFVEMNDKRKMNFDEIAWVVLHGGINPLREALRLEPYEDDDND